MVQGNKGHGRRRRRTSCQVFGEEAGTRDSREQPVSWRVLLDNAVVGGVGRGQQGQSQ